MRGSHAFPAAFCMHVFQYYNSLTEQWVEIAAVNHLDQAETTLKSLLRNGLLPNRSGLFGVLIRELDPKGAMVGMREVNLSSKPTDSA